ncbi:MAG: hypothetical protein ACI3YX_04950 [Prevotella sp.]
MQIIEQTVVGKHSPATCEDGIVVTPDFAAVIDGSTSKSPIRIDPTMSNGRLCMEAVVQFIRTRLAADATLEDFCKGVTDYIAAIYQQQHVDIQRLAAHPWERPTASAAVYSRHRNEIWLVGDCQCLTQGQRHAIEKPAEHIAAEKRAACLRQALAQRARPEDLQANDIGRAAIYTELIDSCKRQNKDFAVIDGFPIAMQHVAAIEAGDTVVLATDGYPFLHDTLSASERHLQELLRTDPLCIHHYVATKGLLPGNQSFDDRAYIRFIT